MSPADRENRFGVVGTGWITRTYVHALHTLNHVQHALHAPVSLAALAAGKHVLCEKPLATTLEDAARMGQAAASADVRALSDAIYRSARAGRRMEFASADAVA
jgi:predicted dehydrogenase